jgi:hypothetical protein
MSLLDKTRNFFRDSLASIILAGGVIVSGSGCGDLYETGFIKDTANKIINNRETLIQKYQKESGIDLIEHPERKEVPVLTKNPDSTYTLFYRTEFTDTTTLEKIVKEQLKDATVSTSQGINQLIINLKNESQISYLEELLNNLDRLPPQVIVELDVYKEHGNLTQDIASEVDIRLSSQGRRFGASTVNSNLPGQATRVNARANMGTKWGVEVDTDVFDMTAILDVLESHGYVTHLYKTSMLLANHQKGILTGEEKLPIPSNVVAGRDIIQTYIMENVKSSAELTPVIYENGIVNLSIRASIGSAKRPEARVDFQVPSTDEMQLNNVYLRTGQRILIAGKASDMDIATLRKNGLFPWWPLLGKDREKIADRIWYGVTLRGVTYWDYKPLQKLSFELRTLESKIPPAESIVPDPNSLVILESPVIKSSSKYMPNEILFNRGIIPVYKMPKSLITEVA